MKYQTSLCCAPPQTWHHIPSRNKRSKYTPLSVYFFHSRFATLLIEFWSLPMQKYSRNWIRCVMHRVYYYVKKLICLKFITKRNKRVDGGSHLSYISTYIPPASAEIKYYIAFFKFQNSHSTCTSTTLNSGKSGQIFVNITLLTLQPP